MDLARATRISTLTAIYRFVGLVKFSRTDGKISCKFICGEVLPFMIETCCIFSLIFHMKNSLIKINTSVADVFSNQQLWLAKFFKIVQFYTFRAGSPVAGNLVDLWPDFLETEFFKLQPLPSN